MSNTEATQTLVSGLALVVVNYNGGAYLPRCLQAIYSASHCPERVIVVDNASSDDSLAQGQAAFPQVEWLAQSENLGFAEGNNVGFRAAADMQWLACINPDAFVEKDWLEALLPYMQDDADLDFLSCQLISAEAPECIDGAGDCYHVSGLVWRRLHGISASRSSRLPFFSACGAAALFRKSAVDAVGGFDAAYFCYSEDIDLGFRLRLSGYQGQHVTASRVRHIGSGITVRDSDFTIYHGHRNLIWTYFKNMPSRLLWRYLPQHVLMNLIAVAYFLSKGRWIILKAKWDALKGLPRVWKQRTEISQHISSEELTDSMVSGWRSAYWGRQR